MHPKAIWKYYRDLGVACEIMATEESTAEVQAAYSELQQKVEALVQDVVKAEKVYHEAYPPKKKD